MTAHDRDLSVLGREPVALISHRIRSLLQEGCFTEKVGNGGGSTSKEEELIGVWQQYPWRDKTATTTTMAKALHHCKGVCVIVSE